MGRMGKLETKSVELFSLVRRGEVRAIALSRTDLYDHSVRRRRDDEIVVESIEVGLTRGEVFDWSKCGGHSFAPKLHWCCPNCGQEWFEDFDYAENCNPAFRASGCGCVRYWLIAWDPGQAADERMRS